MPVSGSQVSLGSDFIHLQNLTLATGQTSVVIYGDAQIAGSGSNVRAGDDYVMAENTTSALTIYGDFQSVAGATVIYGNDRLMGGTDADVIYGDAPNSGSAGGNDLLFGWLGADALYGGGGYDILGGGDGADFIDGGEGFDYAAFYFIVVVGSAEHGGKHSGGGGRHLCRHRRFDGLFLQRQSACR